MGSEVLYRLGKGVRRSEGLGPGLELRGRNLGSATKNQTNPLRLYHVDISGARRIRYHSSLTKKETVGSLVVESPMKTNKRVNLILPYP